MTHFEPIAYSLSDRGKKRERNEDAFLILPKCQLFMVADGMGGHAGGAIASQIAIETTKSHIEERIGQANLESVPGILADAVRKASKLVFQKAVSSSNLKGMGTTLTVLLIFDGKAHVAHVGDSRAYLIRKGFIKQISEDHSLVQEQFRAGLLDFEQAKNSKYRNIITRSIGFEEFVSVDLIEINLKSGDQFLLCTDGLTNLVDDSDILEIIKQKNIKQASQNLINLANERGGSDNITVLIVHV